MQHSSTQPAALGLFKRLLTPPIFVNEDSKTRTAASLHAVLVANFAFVLALSLFVFFTSQPNYLGGLIAFMITLVASMTPLFILRRGKVHLAAGIFLVSLWLMTSSAFLVSNGDNSMVGSLYIAVMTMTLLFFGWRASVFSVVATLAFNLFIGVVDLSDLPRLFVITPLASWLLLCLSLILILIPVGSMYSALVKALGSVQEQLNAREKAEQTLRENEERFRLISKATSDYTFSTYFDEQGNLTNQILDGAFEKITGYTPDEFINMGGWTKILHPADFDQYMNDARVLYTNQTMVSEARIIRKEGQIRWVQVSAFPMWDAEAKKVIGINGGVQDINARKQAEITLQQNEERFRLISTVTSDYTFSSRYNAAGGLDHQVLSGAFEKITGYNPDEFIAIGGWASILHPDDRELDQRGVDVLRQNKPSTGEVRIVRKDGQVRWVHVSAYPIWDAERQMLIGINGGVQDITARKEAEFALQENEKRYRMTTELISDYAYAFDIHADGTMTCSWVTEQPFKRVSGYDWDDMRAQVMLYHPDDALRARQDSERTARGEATSGEYRIITASGEIKWLHIQRQPEWDGARAKPIRFYGAAKDITARKQAENALQESERRYRLTSELISDYAYAYTIGEDGTRTLAWITEQSFNRLTGFNSEEMRNRTEIYHPDDRDRVRSDVDKTMRGEATDSEYRIVTASGDIKWLHVVRQVEWNEANTRPICYYGSAADITDRKLAELALVESEQRYRMTAELISDYAFAYDVMPDGSLELAWGTEQSYKRVTGYDWKTFPTQPALYHPDDRERLLADRERAIAGDPIIGEYRIVTASGDIKWVVVKRALEWDATHTRPLRFYGALTDITERKLAENAIRESETLLRAVIDHIPDPIYVKDLDCRFLINNQASISRIGVQSQAEVTGKTDFDFYPQEVAAPWDQHYRWIMASGTSILNEEVCVELNGEEVWFSASFIPFRDMEGKVIGIVSINRDITARKQAENALQESERRYRQTSELISDYAYSYTIAEDGMRTLSWITEQSFERLTGYNIDIMRQRVDIYHPDDRERVLAELAKTVNGEPTSSEYRIVTASGEIKWLHVERQAEWDADHTRPIHYYGSATDITERKLAEQALQRSEASLRALLDATNDVAFLMSADFRILTANKPMSKTVGKPLEALIGETGSSLIQSDVYAQRHQYFEEVLRTKEPVRWIDSRNAEQWDNSIYPVLSPAGEVESFAVFGRDISEESRLAAELQRYATQLEHMVEERTTELRRAKEQIEIILNNTRDAIALAHPNGDIQTRNPAFIAMFGEQVSRWIEGLLWTVAGEEHSGAVGQALVDMMHTREGKHIETQITVDEKGDKDIDLMFIPVSLETESEQPGILVSAHDITRLKEIERFKARFVADAVHDLATPIAGLSTRLYLLKRSPEKLDVHMKALENQVEHFRDLLSDLRTLSQLDRKQLTLDLQMVNVQQNIRRVFDTYEPVALSKDQTLDLVMDPDLPDMLLDRRQVERVFLNLVSNAINYSPEGKLISIRVSGEGDNMVFAVTDEGIGMSAEEQAHVFERFYRTERARQTRSGGTGLGLAIVKEIIELHGGTVTVESETGKGSTFTVRLPIKTA